MNITDQLAQALEGAGDHVMLAPHSEHCKLGYAGNDCTCGLWALMSTITDALNAYRASKEGEKVEYRFLDEGERPSAIKGDQVKFAGEWRPWTSCSVRPVESHETTVFRRPIRATWQDETAQRLADNYKAAVESGNLPEVP